MMLERRGGTAQGRTRTGISGEGPRADADLSAACHSGVLAAFVTQAGDSGRARA